MYYCPTRSLRTLAIPVACATFAALATAEPVMFVTQTPVANDFTTVVATFGNHRADANRAPRGGDLYIRYDDGTLRNLTDEAGYGQTSETEITVRDPHVHWGGNKALFSMVIGGTTQNDLTEVYYQIYEVTGLGQGETVSITKLNQPEEYNNITPVYTTDDRILFTTDQPHNGDRRLYPPLDEYESTPINSGIWVMNADGTGVEILDHSPSGNFDPFVDSFGRVVFTRWDHLQRDQQAGGDMVAYINGNTPTYGANTYASEDSDSFRIIEPGDETFPENRVLHGPGSTADPVWDAEHDPTEIGLRFNQFFPWMMHEDGTELETLNHIGRHELFSYAGRSRTYLPDHNHTDPRIRESFLQMAEDPTNPGYYVATAAPEFGTHASGQIVGLYGPPSENPDDMRIEYFTPEETQIPISDSDTPTGNHSGLYRDPFFRTDGTLWAAHSESPYADRGTVSDPGVPNNFPISTRYNYRIRQLTPTTGDGSSTPSAYLLNVPIVESITYFENQRYRTVEYNGPMWELQPVSVASRPRPTPSHTDLPAIEQTILEDELGGSAGITELKEYLEANNLALVVSRDVTIRADKQQDYNLKVAWSDHENAEDGETPKEIGWMQFFAGNQVRGYDIRQGRRVLAQPMTDDLNPDVSAAPEGAVRIGDDGSMAAFVPAKRAMSWQLTEEDGTPSIRERYWVTFQPGEIRSCKNCHGINQKDVLGNDGPTNEPEAFKELLQWWKSNQDTSRLTDWNKY